MNYAQGNTRSLPDGFLHVQNFTVTKAAGVAAVIYTHVLDESQKLMVQDLLVERASYQGIAQGELLFHVKHGTVRFQKKFLKDNFREVVHAFTKLTRQPCLEDLKAKLIAERESLVY